jgi:signal transduction histidine kinase
MIDFRLTKGKMLGLYRCSWIIRGNRCSLLLLLLFLATFCRAQQTEKWKRCLSKEEEYKEAVSILSGEWQFYFGKHLSAKEMRALPAGNRRFVGIRQGCTFMDFSGLKAPPLGVSTYYYRIVLKQKERDAFHTYGLHLGMVSSAYKLWINDHLIGSVGQAGTDKDDFSPFICPRSFYFTADSDTMDVVVQVSNFFDSDHGGIQQSLFFGKKDSLERFSLRKIIFSTCLLCILFMIFVYHLILSFSDGFKQINFLLSLLSLSHFFKILNENDLLLFYCFPNMSFLFHCRIWLILVLLIISLVFRILKKVFPSDVHFPVEKIICVLSAVYIWLIATANIDFVLHQRVFILYASFACMGYVLYVLVRAALNHWDTALIHVLSFALMSFLYVNDYLFIFNQQHSGYLSQIGVVQYLFILTGIIVRKQARYQNKVIVLSQELIAVNQTLEGTVKERTADLQTANIELSKLSRQKDFLLSTISHDLINSFNILLNFTKLLSKDDSLSEENRNIMMRLYRTSEKGFQILDNTLLWAKIQISKRSEMSTITLLSYIMMDNIRQDRDVIDAKGLQVDVDVDNSLLFRCNEGHLQAILRNLLSNAVKFSRAGGVITFRNQLKDGWVEITIQDEGMGMSSEQCHDLFDCSTDVRRRGTNGEVGAGIGLLIVKELVEVNQGTICCTSKENEGTVFSINFKLYDAKENDIDC